VVMMMMVMMMMMMMNFLNLPFEPKYYVGKEFRLVKCSSNI